MLYIITYATHSERYFNILKESYPNIIVLGFGTKWTGFYDKIKATINFCKDRNDDDLILFVDGFDSIILHTDDLIEKYKSFSNNSSPLIFSKDLNPPNVIAKYMQDSFFSTCQSLNLNTGMYIGPPKLIIEFWKDIKLEDDDQIYATKQCNNFTNEYIKIDKYCKLFYNYTSNDNIYIENNKVKIGNEYPNIISAPANGNIDNILIKLRYKITENVTEKFFFTRLLNIINKYLKIPIIFLIILIIMIIYIPNKKLGLHICLFLFIEYLNYNLYLKHLDTAHINKMIYILINFLQFSIIYIIFLLFNNFKCDTNKLLLLNTIYFFILILFFVYKKCIFKVVKELFTGINKHISRSTQMKYFLDQNKK
jgi:hypothetical protein